MIFLYQRLNKRHNFIYMPGRPGFLIRRQDSERRFVFVHRVDESGGEVGVQLAVLVRTVDYFVVDIGDVANVVHFIAARAQIASHDIESDKHAGVTQMQVVVGCNATNIDPNLAGLARNEFFLCACKTVVDFHLDPVSIPPRGAAKSPSVAKLMRGAQAYCLIENQHVSR